MSDIVMGIFATSLVIGLVILIWWSLGRIWDGKPVFRRERTMSIEYKRCFYCGHYTVETNNEGNHHCRTCLSTYDPKGRE